MSVSQISSTAPQHHAAPPPKAKSDEQTESAATKAKEAATAKNSKVQVQPRSTVDITA
jgi:hypothetical protein